MSKIFLYADEWNKAFGCIEDKDYNFYYFSLYFNNLPVYKIIDKKKGEIYEIYHKNNIWKISNNFYTINTLDCSFRKPLHPLIPPMTGWHSKRFKKIMRHIIPRYYNEIIKIDNNYDWWKIKYIKNISPKFKKIILCFLLATKKYSSEKQFNFPLELTLLIFSNFKVNYNN